MNRPSRLHSMLRVLAVVVALAALLGLIIGARLRKPSRVSANTPAHNQAASMPGMPGMAAASRKILYWYDPMHPAYRSDKPGKAPDCGMDLVPAYDGGGPTADGMIAIDAQRQQLLGVRTATVMQQALTRTLRASGQVVPDETRIAHVHVKTSGWLENVYANFVGQAVRQGQPLFTIYSPDLVATQQEYLIAKRGEQQLKNAPYQDVAQGAQSLLASARERLRLWDMTDEQIRKLDETGQVSRTVTYYSPVSGYVVDRKAFPQTAAAPDTDLYTIADLSRVWVTADVYEYELPYVKIGQPVSLHLTYEPGRTFQGRVAYILPVLDPQTHTAKVRIDVPNPRLELKPNMFADVELTINYGRHLVVPSEAVLDSGTMQTVYVVHDGGKFEPRKVTVGPQVDKQTIVMFGLEPGETIVASGNFLVDSESRLKAER